MHRPKAVLQRHAAHCSIVHRCKVHASAVHELCAKGKPLGRIMVAGNKTYAAALSGQHSQKLIQQRHSLCRRHSLVVHISGNQHGIHCLTCCDGSNLIEDVGLIFQE